MVQICDSIYRETVDASMHAAAQMIQNEKQEMLDLIRAMVQKEVSIEVEKLKMAVFRADIFNFFHFSHGAWLLRWE